MARNSADEPGFAELDEEAAETPIAKGLAESIDVSYPAVRLLNPFVLPGRDLSNDGILHVVDGVDVPPPISFAYTEAESLLEQITTNRSRLKNVPEKDYRERMRTAA